MSQIVVTYDLNCSLSEATAVATDLAYEQTVEVPPAVAHAAGVPDDAVAQLIDEPEPLDDGRSRVRVAFASHLASGHLSQLLNLLYGNISIKSGIRLVALELPADLLQRFRGPAAAPSETWRRIGAGRRPLLATALKPRGVSNDHFARLARDFVRGGGDLIKDDHNLAEPSLDAFRTRVDLCQSAVQTAARERGRPALYCPLVAGPIEQFDAQLRHVASIGAAGVLVCPFIIGLDVVRSAAERFPHLLFLAHPAFAGTFLQDRTHGVAPRVLLGTLPRLAGCTISIFPNHGGRFGLAREECAAIADGLADPLGGLHAATPAPAGGMQLSNVAAMAELYGPDAVFLIGGGLLGHADGVEAGANAFRTAIDAHFEGADARPHEAALTSACEWPPAHMESETSARARVHLAQRDFHWDGRDAVVYKSDQHLPFAGVARTELFNRSDLPANFDLRYFELAPGGYTSHERHAHVHVVVAVRGSGAFVVGDDEHPLAPLDVAFTPPEQPHQFRNVGSTPFGFFCVVDRDRDRPRAP